MYRPLISVILPVYNVAEYLDKCMNSILSQTYNNLEIILVDDGATDKSPEICDLYAIQDSRVVVYHKQNGGLSDARNYGIERATGEYITCVDSDDFVDLDYVQYLYELVEKYDTRMSLCQHRVLMSDGKIVDYGNRNVVSEVLSCDCCLERMLYHDVIDTSAWAKLYHISLFKDVKYPKGKLFEDIGTTYKFFILSECIAVGYESKYNYIVRGNSIVNSRFNVKKLDLLEMTDDMAKNVVTMYPHLKDATVRRQVYARISTLNQMIGQCSNEEKIGEMVHYIRMHGLQVLLLNKTPFRDRLAILLLCINVRLYTYAWGFYKNG